MKLSGWGRYPVLDCRVEPLREIEALPALVRRSGTLIARGNGRSYGDAALDPNLTLSTLPLARIGEFDPETGRLTCEAGVLLADILERFVPRGWFPPVVPGTKFVTVGGMIAADVHGKNHHRDGSFGAHLESLVLFTADGAVRQCSRTEHPGLFRATVGGMGLTGVILSASFRLRPIETAFVMAETLVAPDLDETLALLEASHEWPFTVAWTDCLGQGAKLGRSLVMRGAFLEAGALPPELATDPLRVPSRRQLRVPGDAPAMLLNRASVRCFNGFLFRRAGSRSGARAVPFERFFFPLDRIGDWNRLYGRRGFLQYQCVLPGKESPAGISALLQRITKTGSGCFLAVLKLFGPAGDGLLSFPREGCTLALDFPRRSGVLPLLDDLDAITHRHGGRVYLAKDARLAPERLREGYPRLGPFREAVAAAAGSPRRFASALSRRLAL